MRMETRATETLHGWESSSESVKGEGVVLNSFRTIHKIAQDAIIAKAIQEEIEGFGTIDLYQYRSQSRTAVSWTRLAPWRWQA